MRRERHTCWFVLIGPACLLAAGAAALWPGGGPHWIGMWLVALGIYAGCKALTWALSSVRDASFARQLGYLLAWPGMNADDFLLAARRPPRPKWTEFAFAAAKLLLGIALVWVAVPRMAGAPHWRGWLGMIGLVFVLHFGVFDLMSWTWRRAGVVAPPLMDWPIRSRSLAEFWGRRWNTAFRDLAHRFLFHPFARRWGAAAGVLAGFFASGLAHELVITVPAAAGWGGPTLYFFLQGGAILFERSAAGQRLGLGRGWRGWCFTLLVLAAPVALLFPAPFVREIIEPTLDFLTGDCDA